MGYIKVKDMTKEQYKEYRNKAKSYYDKNKEKIKSYSRLYASLHKKELSEYRISHLELYRVAQRKFKAKNREKLREIERKRRLSNPAMTVWQRMMSRCGLYGKPSKKDIKNYISRGITVCEEWRVRKAFEEWAYNHGFKKGLQLDRIDNNGNYCPENCRFVTPAQNNDNRRNTVNIEIDGQQVPANWYFRNTKHDSSVSYKIFISRVKKLGWSVENALSTEKS